MKDLFKFKNKLYLAVETNKNQCDDCNFSGNSRFEIKGCANSPPCSRNKRADGFEIIWKNFLTKETSKMLEEQIKRIADSLESIAEALGGLEFEKADTKKADTKKADTKKANTKKANTEKANTEKANTKKASTEKAEDTEAPSLEDVVKALQAYMKEEGRDAAVELLDKYGAKRASDVEEEKRAEFIADASTDSLAS